jgi:hypothetical protein
MILTNCSIKNLYSASLHSHTHTGVHTHAHTHTHTLVKETDSSHIDPMHLLHCSGRLCSEELRVRQKGQSNGPNLGGQVRRSDTVAGLMPSDLKGWDALYQMLAEAGKPWEEWEKERKERRMGDGGSSIEEKHQEAAMFVLLARWNFLPPKEMGTKLCSIMGKKSTFFAHESWWLQKYITISCRRQSWDFPMIFPVTPYLRNWIKERSSIFKSWGISCMN